MKIMIRKMTTCLLTVALMVTMMPASFGYANTDTNPEAKSIEINVVELIDST